MHYRLWILMMVFGSAIAVAQPSDRNQVRAWPYGLYDKNIPQKLQPLTNRAGRVFSSGRTNSMSARPESVPKTEKPRTNTVQSPKPEKPK